MAVSANNLVVAKRSNKGDMEMYALSKEMNYGVKWNASVVYFDHFDWALLAALPTSLYQRKLAYLFVIVLWDKQPFAIVLHIMF